MFYYSVLTFFYLVTSTQLTNILQFTNLLTLLI